jgi:hypothetical protein
LVLEVEEIELDAATDQQLRRAVLSAIPGAVVRTVKAERVLGDVKTTAIVDLVPFETTPDSRRLLSLRCVLYDALWQCLDPTHVLEVRTAGGVDRIAIDREITTETALEIRQFLLSRPTVEAGNGRRLADDEVTPVYSIRKLDRWKYVATAGSRSLRSSEITIERRFLSWPVGRLAAVKFVEYIH